MRNYFVSPSAMEMVLKAQLSSLMASSKSRWLLLALLVLADVTSSSPTHCHCENEVHTVRCAGCSQLPQILPAGVSRLNMSGNRISHISFAANVSPTLSDLKSVYLNSNNIGALHYGDLCPVENLMILDLSDNNLQYIKEDSIACNDQLKRLVLDNNPRLKLVALRSQSLEEFYVQNCGLTSFDPELLKNLPNLRELHLRGNDDLPPHVVQDIQKRWPQLNVHYDFKPIGSVTTTDRSDASNDNNANTSPRSVNSHVLSDYHPPQLPTPVNIQINVPNIVIIAIIVLVIILVVVFTVVVFKVSRKPESDNQSVVGRLLSPQ